MKPAAALGVAAIAFAVFLMLGAQPQAEPAAPAATPAAATPSATPDPTATPRASRPPKLALASVPKVARLHVPPKRKHRPRRVAPRVLRSAPSVSPTAVATAIAVTTPEPRIVATPAPTVAPIRTAAPPEPTPSDDGPKSSGDFDYDQAAPIG